MATALGAEAVSVVDDRLSNVIPRYAVKKGALAMTCNQFQAQTNSTTTQQYQVIAPARGAVMDRGAMMTVQYKIKVPVSFQYDARDLNNVRGYWGSPVVYSDWGTFGPIYAQDFSLCPYPLTSLCASQMATVNNCAVNMQTQFVKNEVLRMIDQFKSRPYRTTPGMLDIFGAYDDVPPDSPADVLGGMYATQDAASVHNGSFVVQYCTPGGVPILDQLAGGSALGTYTDGPFSTPVFMAGDWAQQSAPGASDMVGFTDEGASGGKVYASHLQEADWDSRTLPNVVAGLQTWYAGAWADLDKAAAATAARGGDWNAATRARATPTLQMKVACGFNAYSPAATGPTPAPMRGTGTFPDDNGQPVFYYKGAPCFHPCMMKAVSGNYVPLGYNGKTTLPVPSAAPAAGAAPRNQNAAFLSPDQAGWDDHILTPTALTTPVNCNLYLLITVQEPLFLSPFIFSDRLMSREQGLWGVDTITVTLNLQAPTQARLLRWRRKENQGFGQGQSQLRLLGKTPATIGADPGPAGPPSATAAQLNVLNNPNWATPGYGVINAYTADPVKTISRPWWLTNANTGSALYDWGSFNGGTPFVRSTLVCEYLTPPVSMQLPARCILPWMEYPYYIYNTQTSVGVGQSARLQTNVVNLPCIPDFIVVSVKPTPSTLDVNDGDYYFTPNNITVAFNNVQGILSAYQPHQLFKLTTQNGLSNMSWPQYSGAAMVGAASTPKYSTGQLAVLFSSLFSTRASWPDNAFKAVEGIIPGNAMVPKITTGSPLVLSPSLDFGLGDGYAAGVIGNFSFQIGLEITNTTGVAQIPVITVMAINSGYFVSEGGSSYFLRGILTESDVAKAETGAAMTVSKLARLVGGSYATAGTTLSAPRHAGGAFTGAGAGGGGGGGFTGGGMVGGKRSRAQTMFSP